MAMLPFVYWMVLSSFILLAHCQSTDILWANGFLNENQTLVSPNKQFELGFFNPSYSPNQYLGIWYTSPNKTVVWVANGDSPISGGNGGLYLTQGGVLVLQNGNGNEIWSRGNQSSNSSQVAILLNLGTLTINDTITGVISWQSSYDLSNTLLPQALLGYIMHANVNIKMQLTSWKSETDPSPGDYVCKLDPARMYELVIVYGEVVTFRSGPWNGSQWNGMPQLGEDSLVQFKLQQAEGSAYFSYYSLNLAYIFRLVMNPAGNLSFLRSNGNSDWEEFQHIPPENSGQYALCGPYGTSNGTTCKCPDVFIPKSPNDWASGNFSHGCVRAEPFNCTTAREFVNISNAKLPDTMNAKGNSSILNLEDCKMWCIGNCSCMAFAILGSQGCVGWFGDLIDTVKLLNDKGESLYIRVAPPSPPPLPSPPSSPLPSPPEPRKKNKFTNIMEYAAMPAAIVGSLIFALICFQCIRWRRKRTIRFPPPNTKMNFWQDELMVFEFNTIKSATNNFSETNKLGGGQFGLVYKGVLNNGEEIAVKRLARNSREGIENSKREVTLLAKLRHPNLVKLLGFCIQEDEEEMLLCYEYMPNRSLDQLLFGNLEDLYTPLYWGIRKHIIEGISAGLLYLHEDSGRAIIHCEIKPSNILLDQNMVPKISDFGLSQLFDQDGFFVKLCMVTSCGHRAPELKKRILTTNADVYSFGILILELVTGQSNSSFPSGLIAHVLQYWEEGNVQELIDPKLKKPHPVNEIQRCIHIALLCLLEQPQMRPKMRDINQMLTNKQSVPNLPHNCSYWGLVIADPSFEDISLL